MKPFKGACNIVQYCFVVDDLDAAIQHWITTTGAGPFFVNHAALDVVYRGSREPVDLSIALGQLGDVHIELIQQNSHGPSVYRDTYPAGKGGFHHVAILAEDFDAACEHHEKAGYPLGMKGVFGNIRFAYYDLTSTVGHFVEILDGVEDVRSLYKMVADSAIGWEGEDPVRAF